MYDAKLKANIIAAIQKLKELKHEEIKKQFILKATLSTNKSPGFSLNVNDI